MKQAGTIIDEIIAKCKFSSVSMKIFLSYCF